MADGRVVSVFGPFNSRALVEMAIETAEEMIGSGEIEPCGRGVIDAIDRDLAELAERDAALAGSGLAAAVRALAFELENPYNSLTSKAMATRELREDLDRLRELAPAPQTRDALDEVKAQRVKREQDAGIATATR